jgi:hypothetical protein
MWFSDHFCTPNNTMDANVENRGKMEFYIREMPVAKIAQH